MRKRKNCCYPPEQDLPLSSIYVQNLKSSMLLYNAFPHFQFQFPDSYLGFGVEVRYTLKAFTKMLIPRNVTYRAIEVKSFVFVFQYGDEQGMPSPLPLTLTISEEDIQMVERPSCSSKSDFCPIVNITCNLSTTEVNFMDGV